MTGRTAKLYSRRRKKAYTEKKRSCNARKILSTETKSSFIPEKSLSRARNKARTAKYTNLYNSFHRYDEDYVDYYSHFQSTIHKKKLPLPLEEVGTATIKLVKFLQIKLRKFKKHNNVLSVVAHGSSLYSPIPNDGDIIIRVKAGENICLAAHEMKRIVRSRYWCDIRQYDPGIYTRETNIKSGQLYKVKQSLRRGADRINWNVLPTVFDILVIEQDVVLKPPNYLHECLYWCPFRGYQSRLFHDIHFPPDMIFEMIKKNTTIKSQESSIPPKRKEVMIRNGFKTVLSLQDYILRLSMNRCGMSC